MSKFDEYIVHREPGQKKKADAWQTVIGLQDVDGLKVSTYLLDTARQHIEGDITIDEVRESISFFSKSQYDTLDRLCKELTYNNSPAAALEIDEDRPFFLVRIFCHEGEEDISPAFFNNKKSITTTKKMTKKLIITTKKCDKEIYQIHKRAVKDSKAISWYNIQ